MAPPEPHKILGHNARDTVFAALFAILILGVGAYLSTYDIGMIRAGGLGLSVVAIYGIVLWALWPYRGKTMTTALFIAGVVFLGCSAVSFVGWYVFHASAPTATRGAHSQTDNLFSGPELIVPLQSTPVHDPAFDRLITIECSQAMPPEKAPDGPIYTLPARKVSAPMGLAKQFHAPGSAMDWSPYTAMTTLRCTVTNFSKKTLTDVRFSLGLTFKADGHQTVSRQWLVRIARLDVEPNNQFVFWVLNREDTFLLISPPADAIFKPLGSDKYVSALMENENPLQPVVPPTIKKKA
jgi:hypothetical protein